MSEYETETLDRLYLEWSQFTNARTKREIIMLAALNKIVTEDESEGSFDPADIASAAIAKATGGE